jgi:hypothetical protein
MKAVVTIRLYGYMNTKTIKKGKRDEIINFLKINMSIEI